MSTRILLLTQWFDPEPTFKGLVFARELVKQGFDVEVVTGFPNYPGGKLYPGFKVKLIQRETIDGVKITRVPLYPSHDQGAIRRIMNYVSFSVSALVYCLFMAKRADVIYAYHPPLTVGITAAIIRLIRRIPVVYDIQDMWPDTLRATGMFSSERALSIVSSVCNWVYRRVDQIVVLSPGFKRLLIERGVPEKKIELIYNWCDEQSLTHPSLELASAFPSSDKFTVLFAGNMGPAQSLSTVLDVASVISKRLPDVKFILLGGGLEVDTLKQQVSARKINNIIFLPPVSMSEVGGYLHRADALLVHLKNDPLFEITIPSKTQAYMAIGKPIIMGVAGDAADIITKANCGFVFEPENTIQLVDAIEKIYHLSNEKIENLGLNARRYYRDNLSLEVGCKQFSHIFNRLADTAIKK